MLPRNRQPNFLGKIMQFNTRLTRAVHLALFGVSTSLLASVTFAQQAPPTQSPELSEIVVTGSLIKRTDTETPSPVQVISAVDLKDLGYTNVSDVLRNLSANGSGALSQ